MRELDLSDMAALVGQELGVSEWLLIDQKRIDDFADVTGDHQWIHVDVERAGRENGGTVAHGFLTLSLVPLLLADVVGFRNITGGLNYGLDTLRFTNPVKAGARIRARQKLVAVEQRGTGTRLTTHVVVEIENESRPALVADFIVLYF